MPYIKQRERSFDKMRKLLLAEELNATRLAEVLGCSRNTAKSRIDNPERITLGELAEISRKAHVPVDSIRAAIL